MFTTRKELLKALGLNEHGEKVTLRRFVSAKKTLNVAKVAKIVGATARPADDKKFHQFRKESYYETVASIKETKLREAEEKAVEAEELMAQEKAQQFAKSMKRTKARTFYGTNKG